MHLDIDNIWHIGKLGDEQFAWLQSELRSTPADMPVCVMSHIPILTATLMIEDDIVNKSGIIYGIKPLKNDWFKQKSAFKAQFRGFM